MSHPGLPLAIAFIAAPFVAVLQSKAMAPLALIPMALTLILGWRAGWRPGVPQSPVLLLGLLLTAWGALTSLWAPEPGRAALLAGPVPNEFGWLKPPIANEGSRLAAMMTPATGRLELLGMEGSVAVTRPLYLN